MNEYFTKDARPLKSPSLISGSFSLRTLLGLMLLAVVGTLLVQRYVSGRARFEVLETDLYLEEGFVQGAVSIRFSQLNAQGTIEYADFVVIAENVRDSGLMLLEEGDEFFVQYRIRSFGPIKNEDPLQRLLVRECGVHKDEIKYYVQLERWTEVHLRGKVNELP